MSSHPSGPWEEGSSGCASPEGESSLPAPPALQPEGRSGVWWPAPRCSVLLGLAGGTRLGKGWWVHPGVECRSRKWAVQRQIPHGPLQWWPEGRIEEPPPWCLYEDRQADDGWHPRLQPTWAAFAGQALRCFSWLQLRFRQRPRAPLEHPGPSAFLGQSPTCSAHGLPCGHQVQPDE